MNTSAPDDALEFPDTPHTAPSEIAIRKLRDISGLPLAVLERIGVLIVYCNFVEMQAKQALLVLRQENARGQVPSTAKYTASQTVKEFRKLVGVQETSVGKAIELVCDTALDLLEYRNCIAHGALLSSGEGARFESNPGPWGELQQRPNTMALINERFLDIAIDAASTVYNTLLKIALETSGTNVGRHGAMVDTLDTLERIKDAMTDLYRSDALRYFHLNGNLGESASEPE